MLAKRSAEGKQAAHRYWAGAFESAFRDVKSNPETPASIQSVQRKEKLGGKKNNERKAPGAFAYAPEASLLLRRKD